MKIRFLSFVFVVSLKLIRHPSQSKKCTHFTIFSIYKESFPIIKFILSKNKRKKGKERKN